MSHSVHFVAQLVLPCATSAEVLAILKIMMDQGDDEEPQLPDRRLLPEHPFFDHPKWHQTLFERRDWPSDELIPRPRIVEDIAMEAEETPVFTIFTAGSPKNGRDRLELFAEWIAPYLLEGLNEMPFLVIQDDVPPAYRDDHVKAFYVKFGKVVDFTHKWGQLEVDPEHSYESPTYMG